MIHEGVQQALALHAPVETSHAATMIDGEFVDVEPGSFEDITGRAVRCMTCQGYPEHPCATYAALAESAPEDGDMETARVTIVRTLTDDDVVDYVEAVVPGGDDLPLTEALGMMRLAEDTLIRERMAGDEG